MSIPLTDLDSQRGALSNKERGEWPYIEAHGTLSSPGSRRGVHKQHPDPTALA